MQIRPYSWHEKGQVNSCNHCILIDTESVHPNVQRKIQTVYTFIFSDNDVVMSPEQEKATAADLKLAFDDKAGPYVFVKFHLH